MSDGQIKAMIRLLSPAKNQLEQDVLTALQLLLDERRRVLVLMPKAPYSMDTDTMAELVYRATLEVKRELQAQGVVVAPSELCEFADLPPAEVFTLGRVGMAVVRYLGRMAEAQDRLTKAV